MSNGRMRIKSVREAYVEQNHPYNQTKKRKSFIRLHSYDDTDIAYRSAPEYLRQLMNTSTISNGHSARSLTRTLSASEMTSRNLGNPKYKAQEDYYDEIQALKKELKFFKDDNSNLRARIRRLEEDNVRKRKEIDNLYDTNNGDSRRSSISSSTPTNIIINLKQRLFKLETQLKQKETTIDEMKNDPRWTKGIELEIQNRALFNEIEKQKLEKLNFIQHDYMAAINEETKNVVRKLDNEKRELNLENENLKKRIHDLEKSERDEQLSARHHYVESIESLKELCKRYENEIEQMKDNFKHMRRERDKFRDKFGTISEDFEEIKRQRDQYRQKLGRYEHDRQTGRSSPVLKHDDERYNKRLQSLEESWKKDSRPTTPIRKSNEYINPRSSLISKKSSQYFRHDDWTNDHRVRNFRENHAATVIQRGWRKHNRSHHKTKQDSFDKRNSKMVSPRASQQRLGSKIENLGSGTIKPRPTSANPSNDSALKIVQAALRGYINRTDLDKPSRTQKSHPDDDDMPIGLSRQYGSERKRENFFNQSNSRLPINNRDSTTKFRRSPSPPMDNYRSSSPHMGSKQNFSNDRYKLATGTRFSINDRESLSRPHRSPSPPADIYRSSSPRNIGSKQSLPNDKNKFGSGNRFDREPPYKFQRSSSPSNDRHISPENIRPLSRQSNISSRKSPTNSRQSLKHDDIFDS